MDVRGHRAERAQGPGSRDPACFPTPGTGPSTPFPRQGKVSLAFILSPETLDFLLLLPVHMGVRVPADLPPRATARVFRPTHTLNVAPLRELTGRARACLSVCGRDLTGTLRPRLPLCTSARNAGSPDSSLSCSGSCFWRQPLFVSQNNNDSSAFFPGAGGALLLWASLRGSWCPPLPPRGSGDCCAATGGVRSFIFPRPVLLV